MENQFERLLASATETNTALQKVEDSLGRILDALVRYHESLKELCDKADVVFPPK